MSRKSVPLPPGTAGADGLAVSVGLATATADRVGDGTALGVAVGAAVVATGVGGGLALAATVAVGAGDGEAGGAGGEGDEAALVPSDAQARESLTPGAAAHTDRAGVIHELPSAALRERDTRMKG